MMNDFKNLNSTFRDLDEKEMLIQGGRKKSSLEKWLESMQPVFNAINKICGD